jgi:hypothetical protein
MRLGAVWFECGLAGLLFWLSCTPVLSQVNLLGKPGLVHTPHPFTQSDDRFVGSLSYTPGEQAINNFISEMSDELIFGGFLPLNDRLFLTVNVTYLPKLSGRVGIGDRHFDISLLVLKEKKGWQPSLMLIVTPPVINGSWLSQDVLVVGKTISISSGEFELSAGYASPYVFHRGNYILKERRGSLYLIGTFAGITYRPLPFLGFVMEIDQRRTNLAAFYSYKNKLNLKLSLLELRTLGFQVGASFPLSFQPRELRRHEK